MRQSEFGAKYQCRNGLFRHRKVKKKVAGVPPSRTGRQATVSWRSCGPLTSTQLQGHNAGSHPRFYPRSRNIYKGFGGYRGAMFVSPNRPPITPDVLNLRKQLSYRAAHAPRSLRLLTRAHQHARCKDEGESETTTHTASQRQEFRNSGLLLSVFARNGRPRRPKEIGRSAARRHLALPARTQRYFFSYSPIGKIIGKILLTYGTISARFW